MTTSTTPYQVSVSNDGTIVTVAATGPAGPAGVGVPAGGTSGQVLAKASGTDYDTTWTTSGSGSGDLLASNNLSDLASASTARTNLGLGTASVAATGISDGNVPVFTTGVADDDFLRVNGTSIEGRSASELRGDIGAAATNHNHAAGNITSGTLAVERIPDLAASKITSGTLDAARIPTLSTSGISGLGTAATADTGTGTSNVILGNDSRLTDARTPTTTLDHDASKITSGTLSVARGGTGSATAPMIGVVTAADAAAARTVLGAGTGNGSLSNVVEDTTPELGGDLDVPDYSGDISLTLPTNDGDANQVMTTNGSGVLSFTSISDSYTGHIEAASDKTYTIDPAAATARTITGFYIKSGSGTVTAALMNGSDVVKGSVSVSTSSGAQSSLANTSVAADAVISIVTTSNNSATDVIFSVEYTQ